jgi:hypothetical protein
MFPGRAAMKALRRNESCNAAESLDENPCNFKFFFHDLENFLRQTGLSNLKEFEAVFPELGTRRARTAALRRRIT